MMDSTTDDDDNAQVCNGHRWGEVQVSWFTGNPHRRCLDCTDITLDLSDDDYDDSDDYDTPTVITPAVMTFPAFSEVLGETLTVTVPAAWVVAVETTLAPLCVYGPTYSRGTVEGLRDVTRWTREGNHGMAERMLTTLVERATIGR